ncbi:hypothetical protein F4677DRAFT_403938 [Hypoxylon crocopeplum]|nr:hypothetical protein F4677DRAFT_403938 [Hypoxylon crocopeplum]
MAGQHTTLRLTLTQNKPLIQCNTSIKWNTQPAAQWPDIESVEVWRDFNLSNLNNGMYASLLDFAVPERELACPRAYQMLAGVTINRPNDINHLISRNDALMQATLNMPKSRLRLHPELALSHAYRAHNMSTIAHVEDLERRANVDHVIALDQVPNRNLVVGLGRPSSKFGIGQIVRDHGPIQAKISRHIWPLRQLGHLCSVANTPFGYIQTDKELVACYFVKNGSPNTFRVYIMPIPWSSHGLTVLTTDLALWWLCMMALSHPYPQIRDIAAFGAAPAPPPPEDRFQLLELGSYDPTNPSTWNTELLGSP